MMSLLKCLFAASMITFVTALAHSPSIAASASSENDQERVPVYTAKVSSANGSKAVHSLKVSMNNTHEALRQAIAECEAARQAALQAGYCEPVSVDGESVVTAAQLRAEAKKMARPKISLFRFNSERGTVYLFGSVHLMKRNVFPLDKRIMSAFAASDTLVLEVNIGAIDPSVIQQAFLSRGRYQDGDTLSGNVSKETLTMIKDVLSKRGLALDGMNGLRPWLFEQTLVTQEMRLYGFDPAAGIDTFFDQKARASNKQILQLETLEEQLNLMSSASSKEQEISLRYTLETLQKGSMQTELNALVVDWMEGDVHGLFDSMSQPMEQYPELQKYMVKLFDERNVAMAEKISGWIKEGGDYFVIVGAGHLGGPNGIVKLLQQKGLAGEQIAR